MQRKELASLLAQGPAGYRNAWALFERILARGLLDVAHLDLMMGKGCRNDSERRALLERAEAADVDVSHARRRWPEPPR